MKKLWFAIGGILLLLPAASLLAQSAATSQGLTISPFLLERQMDKGSSSSEIIDITNTSDRSLPVNITVNDFIPVGDNGQQQFVDPGQGDPHYSLSKWITFTSNPKPTLAPGEKTSLSFNINVPQDAEDGGHYGAILFGFQSSQSLVTGSAVEEKIGAIILVKTGKVNESGQVVKFGPEHGFYEYPPVSFTTLFKNTGNVHVKPRGAIGITNMFGTKVASVQVNENANNVLPNTERTFTSAWKDSFGFGRYTAKEQLVYGDSGQVVTMSASFWVIPWKTSLLVALIIFIVLMIFIGGMRVYNKWLTKKILAQRK